MPLTAVRHLRKMRGGAQAHLIEADDRNCYVVKFRNNPQHRRVLVNEVLSAEILKYLKITVPQTGLIRVTREFLQANPECCLQLGGRRIDVEPGWQFASRHPGDPDRIATYDFLPDKLLGDVVNLSDFRAILVFDKWTCNADGRQCVFYRAMVRDAETRGGRPGFVAAMIDHGYAFNGPNWDFPESAIQGLYGRTMVYRNVRSLDDFQPWLDQVIHFPEEVMDRAWKSVPPEWIDGEEDALDRLLEQLWTRRARAPELIAACRNSRVNPFPNWP
jgi:HipA-like protein